MRNIAVRNAMGPVKRRRQPRTFALLPSGSGVPSSRFAVQLERALARIGGEAQMLGSEFAGRGSRVVRALRARPSIRALSRRSRAHAVDPALPAPGRLPGRAAQRRYERADPPAVRDRGGAARRGVPSPPRAGAAARRPRSAARLDRRPARRRAVRPASSCAARPAVGLRPAGAADHRPCGRHRHGRRRRARLHPYRRGQGAARLGRAGRPGRRHQHGRDRRRRDRRALGRRGARHALPPLLRHHQSAERLHAALRLAVRRPAGDGVAAHRLRRPRHRGSRPAVLLRDGQPHDRQRRHPYHRQAVALAARLGVAARACCRRSTTPATSMSTAA